MTEFRVVNSRVRLKRKTDLPAGECLCNYCVAKCCKYFALQIDTPTTKQEFDYLRWFMIHGRVSVFVDEGVWYLMVHNECRHLRADNLCGIYDDRPEICREYSTDNCEFEDDALYDKLFETPEQIWEYAQATLLRTRPRKRKRQSALPPEQIQLPIVSV